jgi:hypothetical protein
MSKRAFLAALFVITVVLCAAQERHKPVITVLDLTVSEVSQAEMKMIIGLMSSSLFQTGFFTVIDVSQRENVLKELQFSMSGCTDESCMLEIGKMLAAEGIVVGSIGRVGTKYVLSVKLLETESGKTLSTADGIYKDLDALLDGTFALAAKLASPYGTVAAQPAPPPEQPAEEPAPAERQRQKKERPPVQVNVPAIATLAGALGGLGAGGYFLAVSLPLLMAYTEAKDAYELGDADAGDDIAALYAAYEAARVAAVDGDANLNFIIGASAAGVGAALGVVSAILFAKGAAAKKEPVVTGMIVPIPGATTLSFRVRM